MIPPTMRLGPLSIVFLWLVVSMGLTMGADVGYGAETRANATVEYNATSGVLVVGENRTDVWENNPESERSFDNETTDGVLSDRGEAFANEANKTEEMPVVTDVLPDEVREPIDAGAQRYVNESVDSAFALAAWSGDLAARAAYCAQSHVSYTVVAAVVQAIVWAPLVSIFYYMVRKVQGDRS